VGGPVPHWEPRVMSKAKLISVAVLAVLAVVIVLRNIEVVEVDVLFYRLPMPLALLLLITVLLGFAVGVLVAMMRSNRR
jgi:uncharacterized integral membrane protein